MALSNRCFAKAVMDRLEPGYDPAGIAAARISEIATVVLLGALLVAHTTHSRRSS